ETREKKTPAPGWASISAANQKLACEPSGLDGSELKYLGAVSREIQVEAAGLQIAAGTHIGFVAQKAGHRPLVGSQAIDRQRGKALAGVRREIDDYHIKTWRLPLPGENDEIAGGGVIGPGGGWANQFAGSLTQRGFLQDLQQFLVEGLDFGLGNFHCAPGQLDRDF